MNLLNGFRVLGSGLLDVAFPPVCQGCGEAYPGGEIPSVCDPCSENLVEWIQAPYCHVCGQSYYGVMPASARCSNCGERTLEFDFAVGACRAQGTLIDWMHRYKYAGEIHFARTFGRLLASTWKDDRLGSQPEWAVVPVPLHGRRQRERGFNQALEIAREWIRCSPDDKSLKLVQALKRVRYTTRQATLDRSDRLGNLKGAFALSRQSGKLEAFRNVVLVDDVLTTGTTASECAGVLRELPNLDRIVVVSVLRG